MRTPQTITNPKATRLGLATLTHKIHDVSSTYIGHTRDLPRNTLSGRSWIFHLHNRSGMYHAYLMMGDQQLYPCWPALTCITRHKYYMISNLTRDQNMWEKPQSSSHWLFPDAKFHKYAHKQDASNNKITTPSANDAIKHKQKINVILSSSNGAM